MITIATYGTELLFITLIKLMIRSVACIAFVICASGLRVKSRVVEDYSREVGSSGKKVE